MNLSGQQKGKLREGLQNGFQTTDNLAMFLTEQLSIDINNYSSVNIPLSNVAFKIVQASNAEGWIRDLIVAASATRPRQPLIAQLASELGLTGTGPNLTNGRPIAGTSSAQAEAASILESIVKGKSRFIDLEGFLSKASATQAQICRIETSNPNGNGTGFLVAPDLVLTNYHVMESVFKNQVAANNVVCRFDYRQLPDGITVREGSTYKMHQTGWDVANSKYSQADLTVNGNQPADNELDYSLIKLAEAAGEQKAGGSDDPNADDRGWVSFNPNQNTGSSGDDVFVMQHPQGKPLKLAIGEHLGYNTPNNRMTYDADTLNGSSGSPVFNSDLELIGIHHRGDPAADTVNMTADHNQGIPITKIVTDLANKNVSRFWEL